MGSFKYAFFLNNFFAVGLGAEQLTSSHVHFEIEFIYLYLCKYFVFLLYLFLQNITNDIILQSVEYVRFCIVNVFFDI